MKRFGSVSAMIVSTLAFIFGEITLLGAAALCLTVLETPISLVILIPMIALVGVGWWSSVKKLSLIK